jgi:hypothetical protein
MIMTNPSEKLPVKKAPPGPKPDLLKIDKDWKDAVKDSFTKKKPATGWPK